MQPELLHARQIELIHPLTYFEQNKLQSPTHGAVQV